MAWTDQIYNYCERGQSAAFWAEPFNAVSNAAFVAVAIAAGVAYARQPAKARGSAEAALIVLVGLIGVGSFTFHTLATRWSILADVVPITVFMFAYTGYALRRFLRLPWVGVAAGLLVFAGLLYGASAAPCPVALRGLVAGHRCLNGSLGYVPACVMLLGVGLWALIIRERVGWALIAAGVLFGCALVLRSLDLELCDVSRLLGQRRGTHAVWHLLNSGTLALLLFAALRHARTQVSV